MPDWAQEIRAAIARLQLDPGREALLVEELSQHLADRYNELRGEGVGDEEACRLLRAELNDGKLVGELGSILAPAPEVVAPGLDEKGAIFCGSGAGSSPGTAAAAAESWVCGGGDCVAGAGDRGEHGDFRAAGCGSAAHAAGGVATATRGYSGDSRRTDRKHGRAAKGLLLGDLGAVAATAEGILRHCGVEHGGVRPGARGRSALRARDVGERQFLRSAAGAAGGGEADCAERRCGGLRRARGGDQQCVLATGLWEPQRCGGEQAVTRRASF